MMNGGGAPMDPMMMMSLLEDKSCSVSAKVDALDLTAEEKEAVASGKKIWDGSAAVAADTLQDNKDFLGFIDYKYIQCNSKSGSGMSDLLPLMMMNGQGAG